MRESLSINLYLQKVHNVCASGNYMNFYRNHFISKIDFLGFQNKYFEGVNFPGYKMFTGQQIKQIIYNHCKDRHIVFNNFDPNNTQTNDDIELNYSNVFIPDNSCYSIPLFKGIDQMHVLNDTDLFGCTKAKVYSSLSGEDEIRIIFYFMKNGDPTALAFFDVSETYP